MYTSRRLFLSLAVSIVLLSANLAFSQTENAPPPAESQRGGGGMRRQLPPGQEMTGGTITSMTADGFTLKAQDGRSVTVKVGADTRFMRERTPSKLAEFKTGDAVAVAGTVNGDTMTASFVGSRNQAMQRFREGLGKEFIAGEVKKIEDARLTILRPDGEAQTIGVDETTSFRRKGESITLADIKVGDHVFGRGAIKDGTFVPNVLNVGEPNGPRGFGAGGRQGSPPPPPQP